MKRAPATAAAPRAVAAAALAAAAVSCKVLKAAPAAGGEETLPAAADGAAAVNSSTSSNSDPKAALSRGGSIKLVAVAVAEPAPDAIPAVRPAPGDATGVTSGDATLVRVPSTCSSSSASEAETDSCSGSEAGVVLIDEAPSSKGAEA